MGEGRRRRTKGRIDYRGGRGGGVQKTGGAQVRPKGPNWGVIEPATLGR